MQNRVHLKQNITEVSNKEKMSIVPVIRAMTLEDIPTIITIEEVSFPTPWKVESFESELRDNHLSRYYCLEINNNIVGYMGLWIIMGEAHITNIAIWPGCRGQGWGEYLIRAVMNKMVSSGVRRLTLEVRVTNETAQNLYSKVGFRAAGVRKKYYSDNQEDALIMWANL